MHFGAPEFAAVFLIALTIKGQLESILTAKLVEFSIHPKEV